MNTLEQERGNLIEQNDDQGDHPCIQGALLHIVPFCEGPNKKSEGFAKEKQKT